MEQLRKRLGASRCGYHDFHILLYQKVKEQSTRGQIERDVDGERSFGQLPGSMDLKPKVFERVTVVLHSCIGADGTKRSCVGYRGGKLRIGNPQHPPLQDGVPDPEQVTDILISHRHGTLDRYRDRYRLLVFKIFEKPIPITIPIPTERVNRGFFSPTTGAVLAPPPSFPYHSIQRFLPRPWCKEPLSRRLHIYIFCRADSWIPLAEFTSFVPLVDRSTSPFHCRRGSQSLLRRISCICIFCPPDLPLSIPPPN